MPKTAKQRRRRGNLLLALGVLVILLTGFGFWLVIQTIDDRQEYLMADRTINRRDFVTLTDFRLVRAHLGAASAVPLDRFAMDLSGKWATGTIPKGTLVTPGMFAYPTMSSESERDKVVIAVSLPAGDSPYGVLGPDDVIALIGREAAAESAFAEDPLFAEEPIFTEEGTGAGSSSESGPLAVIGILAADLIIGGKYIYIVTPEKALSIERILDRYNKAADRKVWLIGQGVTAEELNEKLATFESSYEFDRNPLGINVFEPSGDITIEPLGDASEPAEEGAEASESAG